MKKDDKARINVFALQGQDVLSQKQDKEAKDLNAGALIETHYEMVQSIAASILGKGKQHHCKN